MVDDIEKRLRELEAANGQLKLKSEEMEKKYRSLLAMTSEAVLSAKTASEKALAAAEKSLFAGTEAATAAKLAAIAGALKVAEAGLSAARAAADAAGDASMAAMEAWKSALVLAGHDADKKNVLLCISAHEASTAATAVAIKALSIFTEAFEEVKNIALK